MKKQQSGFTLIELAIVLVIIGLLLGGVLKGQELINSAKVKNMASDFKNIQVYIYGYQDKFKALPGDDHAAATHVAGATNAANGTQNGVIQGLWNTSTDGDESCVFWQHVRLAGLAPGSTTVSCAAGNAYQPRNADGGLIGVQSVSTLTTITGMTGAYAICSDGILGKFALQLDTTLDDGEPSTGSVRAITSGASGAGMTTAAVNAAISATYTVCLAF
jgi:prepilin-type N-terminal cleavage/methylation domain-containing protein